MSEKTTMKNFEDYFKIVKHKLPYWDELPEIDLYMDQVIALMDKYLSFHKTDDNTTIVTHSMINNYVKLGMMPAPIKKKYSREHIAYLIDLIEIRVERTSIEETLNFFSDLYDSTFNTVLAIGKKFSRKNASEDELFGDTALFMAMGSSHSKYIATEIAKIKRNQ